MCGEPVCCSHCLLKFYKSVALCHVENYCFWLNINFARLIMYVGKVASSGSTVSKALFFVVLLDIY